MTDDVRGEFEGLWLKSTDAKNENSMLKTFAMKWFLAGRASREFKMPDQLSILITMAEWLIRESKKENTKAISEHLHDWLKDQVKALNECDGESGEK